MDLKFCSRLFAIACSFGLLSSALMAQTTTTQIFNATDERDSLGSASYSTPNFFSTTSLNLSCPASASATLSGPGMPTPPAPGAALQPGGNLLVDNNIIVSVTSGATTNGPGNACTTSGGTYDGSYPSPYGDLGYDCFNSYYGDNYEIGTDPDTTLVPSTPYTFDYLGGVGPIDISSYLISGTATANAPQTLNISLADEGVVLTASTIFLTTNCTVTGTSGGTTSGSPITTGSNGSGLTQTLGFNGGGTGALSLTLDLSTANSQNTITSNTSNTAPQGGDLPMSPSTYQTTFTPATSFGTSSCLLHSDELLNSSPACKLYTLECLNLQTGVVAGYECPVSSEKNEVVTDFFDGPSFSLQNIYTPFGMFHEGIGLIMASDGWTGGPCEFDPLSGLEALPCPQNLLVSFTGPGGFGGSGDMNNPNSTFISNAQVPEPNTIVYVAGQWPDGWVNTNNLQVYFLTQPPDLASGAYVLNSSNRLVPLPNTANYIPAPIQDITYGISAAGIPPATSGIQPANEPIAGDVTVWNKPSSTPPVYSTVCEPGGPDVSYLTEKFTATYEPPFIPAVQTINSLPGTTGQIPDGQYLIHYYGQDCAGTQELNFNYVNNTTGWTTNFFTYPVNIDTQKPTISAITLSPTNSPGYPAGTFTAGTAVTAKYSCSDPNSQMNGLNTGSGVVLCGTAIYAPQTEYSVGAQTPLSTSSASSKPYSVTLYAVDGAGNISTGSTVTYTVVKK